ncbi:MAG TPA: GNAT family N-acetyltransferase [Sphingomicrobium sp.]|nr:GNAT family N-acetyltransferase [Sphingomicrobium sp.]
MLPQTRLLAGAAALEQRSRILDGLRDFNVRTAGPGQWQPLCVAILDDDGQVTGGLYGTTAYDWLVIELLFVPEEFRSSGTGSALVEQAESEARGRGCIGAWLDTFSFQARGFYEKLGYAVAGTIPDHPVGGARYFLVKRWGAAG